MKKIIVQRKEPQKTIYVDELTNDDAIFWRSKKNLCKLVADGRANYLWTPLNNTRWRTSALSINDAVGYALEHEDTQEVFVDNEAWKRI